MFFLCLFIVPPGPRRDPGASTARATARQEGRSTEASITALYKPKEEHALQLKKKKERSWCSGLLHLLSKPSKVGVVVNLPDPHVENPRRALRRHGRTSRTLHSFFFNLVCILFLVSNDVPRQLLVSRMQGAAWREWSRLVWQGEISTPPHVFVSSSE